MDEPKVSAAEDIGPSTFIIELRERGPNGPIVVKCVTMHPGDIVAAVGSIPTTPQPASTAPDSEKAIAMERSVRTTSDHWGRLAVAAIVEPPFSLEHEPGKACWYDLSFPNQSDFIEKYTKHCTVGPSPTAPEAGAAARTISFPTDRARAPVGAVDRADQ